MDKKRLRYGCLAFAVWMLCIGNSYTLAQQSQQDSLLTIIKKSSTDSVKIDAWNQLSKIAFNHESFDTALGYAQNAYHLSQKSKNTKGLAMAAGNIANVFLMQSKYQEAIEYNLLSLQQYQALNDEKGQCKVYSNIGIVYFQLSLYPKALHSFLNALKMDTRLKDSIGIAQDYRDIGMVYNSLENYDKALNNYQKALNIQTRLEDEVNVAITQSNIALIYSTLNKNEEAIRYYKEAISTFERLDNTYGLSYFYNGIGIVYKNLGNYDLALEYYRKALAIKIKFQEQKGIAEINNNIGKLYLLKNNTIEAQKWLIPALKTAHELRLNTLLVAVYQNLSAADSMKGDYKSALYNFRQAVIYKDSIFNDDNQHKIERLKMDYEFSQKEDSLKMDTQKEIALKEAALLTQKREMWFLVACLLLIGVIGVLLFYQNRTHRKSNIRLALLNKELDKEVARNQLLNKEMYHRIKNNLYMVYSLLNIQEHSSNHPETQEHLSAARQRIESIASLHEQLYHKSPGKINLQNYLSKFIEHIHRQFAHERLIQMHLDMDEHILIEVFLGMPIAMLMNEWITNSVKHAQTGVDILEIYISAKVSDEQELVLEYFDNGLQKVEINEEETDENEYKSSGGAVGSRIITLLCRQIKGKLDSNYHNEAYHYLVKLKI